MKLQLKARALSAAVVMTTVVVILFAALQYRWSVEVSEATGVRLADTLQLSMINWHLDFLRNFSEICLTMRVDPDHKAIGDLHQFATRVAEWKAVARYPDLVSEVYVIPAGGSARHHALRLNSSSREFEPVESPAYNFSRGRMPLTSQYPRRWPTRRRAASWEPPFEVGASSRNRQLSSTGPARLGSWSG